MIYGIWLKEGVSKTADGYETHRITSGWLSLSDGTIFYTDSIALANAMLFNIDDELATVEVIGEDGRPKIGPPPKPDPSNELARASQKQDYPPIHRTQPTPPAPPRKDH